jgi:hypothetical protein
MSAAIFLPFLFLSFFSFTVFSRQFPVIFAFFSFFLNITSEFVVTYTEYSAIPCCSLFFFYDYCCDCVVQNKFLFPSLILFCFELS